MRTLRHVLRVTFSQFRNSPGVTIAAVVCLSTAMAGGAFLYSMAVETLLKPSPAAEPDRLVRIYTGWEGFMDYASISYPDYEDVRDQIDAFESLAVATILPMNLSSEGRSERVWGSLVSGEYFTCLGIDMAMGRGFLPEEDETEGTHPVTVISNQLWQSRFAADPDIVGNEMQINGYPFTIIGVTPPGFTGHDVGLVHRFWVPMMMHEKAAPWIRSFDERGDHWIRSIICRLKPGVTVEQATAQVKALATTLAEQYPEDYEGKTLNVLPERKATMDPTVRGGFQQFISFGFVIVALVLLLACANVAGLLLARTAGRRREIGIRLALGSGRPRLIRQLLAESAALALAAGILGYLIAYALGSLSGGIQVPMDIPLEISSGGGFYWSDVFFVFGITIVATIFVGLTPALQASREDIVSALKAGGGTAPRRATGSRRMLVVVQVAASLVLLVGGGLVLKGLRNIQDVDPGFDPQNQLVASVDLTLQGYSEEKGRDFFRDLKERLRTLPGVKAVGSGLFVPLSLMQSQHTIQPEGYESPDDAPVIIDVNMADADYFEAMGIPVIEGRVFTEQDDKDSQPVMVINQAFAERFWPGESPIGKRVLRGEDDWFEVVGMVPTGKYVGLAESPKPYFYYSIDQLYEGARYLHIRTEGDPLALADAVRREVAALDPTLPVSELNTMEGRIGFAMMPYIVANGVMWIFAVLALLLASIGLYGLVAYFVQRQTREIGVRMALGAQNSDVLQFVVGRGMKLTVAGLIIGLVLSVGISFMASQFLPGLSPFEPVSMGIALVMLAGVAFLASYFPARRAVRISPSEALRAE